MVVNECICCDPGERCRGFCEDGTAMLLNQEELAELHALAECAPGCGIWSINLDWALSRPFEAGLVDIENGVACLTEKGRKALTYQNSQDR